MNPLLPSFCVSTSIEQRDGPPTDIITSYRRRERAERFYLTAIDECEHAFRNHDGPGYAVMLTREWGGRVKIIGSSARART